MNYHHIPTQMANMRRQSTPRAGCGAQQPELSHAADGNSKLYSHFENQFDSFLKN